MIIFGKVFSKMTHNLVFAGQPRRTATLPQNGHGAWLETCSCQCVFYLKCYRGCDPPNRNVARREIRDMQSVGLISLRPQQLGLLSWLCVTRCRGAQTQLKRQSYTSLTIVESQDQLSDVRILSRAVRGCFKTDVLDLVECVHLCRVKTKYLAVSPVTDNLSS